MNQKIAVPAVFVAATFMNILDTTIVNVALPTLGREFGVKPASVDTVAIAYLVSLAVFIPVSAWLGDRIGAKRVMLIAVAIFTGESALCGAASSLGGLVAFRVLQGVGGGLMIPVGMALLYRTFPPAERVRASSIIVVPTAIAPATGPVIGGLFVTELSWRWVFYVNLPIGIAAIAFGLYFLEEKRDHAPGDFDLVGFVLAASGLGLTMYGVSEGPFRGWGDALIVAALAAGAALLATLVWLELRSHAPMIDIRLYKDHLFRSSVIVLGLAQAAFLGVLFLVALFYQDALGLSALQSGLGTFPEAIGSIIGAQVVLRWLYPVLGPRRVMAAGMTILAVSLLLLTLIGAHTSLWWPRLLVLLSGYGIGHVFLPSQAAGFATISAADTARASTLFNAQRQLGSAVGVALLSSVVAAVGPVHVVNGKESANLVAYHAAFVVAAGLAMLGAIVALTIRDSEAHQTMVRRGRLARRDAARAAVAPAV